MAYLGEWTIDAYLTFRASSHGAATGGAADADSSPAYRVYEDETGTPILTGTMALLDAANTTGFYTERIQLTAASGFEVGKCYTIYVSGLVDAVEGTVSHTFSIVSSGAVLNLTPDAINVLAGVAAAGITVALPPGVANVLAGVQSATPTMTLNIVGALDVASAVLAPGLAVNLAPLAVDVLVATQTPGVGMTLSANRLDVAAAVEAAAPTIILAANAQDVQALANAIGITLGLNPASINVTATPQHPTIPGLAATRTIIVVVKGARSH